MINGFLNSQSPLSLWARLGINAAVAFVIAFILLKLEKKIAGKWITKYDGINARFAGRVIRSVIIFIAVMWVIMSSSLTQSFGSSLFQGTAVLAAIAGFAAKPILSDMFCGFMISTTKPFNIGDRIELDDGTAGIVKSLMAGKFKNRVHLVERSGKLGLGTAYIRGFQWAIEHKADYIFEMDADFSHNPNDLIKLYDACANQGADLAIGSRYVTGVNVVNWPMGRVLMSYFASKYVRTVLGVKIHDTTAGFVCYKRHLLETIELDKIRFKGYAFQIEMKFTAHMCGAKIIEVPIIFVNRVLGTSKMSGGIFSEALLGVIRLKVSSWFRKYPKL